MNLNKSRLPAVVIWEAFWLIAEPSELRRQGGQSPPRPPRILAVNISPSKDLGLLIVPSLRFSDLPTSLKYCSSAVLNSSRRVILHFSRRQQTCDLVLSLHSIIIPFCRYSWILLFLNQAWRVPMDLDVLLGAY